MTTLPTTTVIQSIIDLLTEAYAGPPNPSETWFIDNEPDAGILGLIRSVSAAEASTSMDGSGKEGTTIAAHVEHLRWSVANINATIQGKDWNPKWSESWLLRNADEAAWDRLRQEVQAEYETLCRLLNEQTALPGEFLKGTLALVPHAAFHLGVIRQMVERVRAAKSNP